VTVGKNSIIAAQTGISGSTRIGENVKMAGQVGVIGHLTIEDNTVIAAQSGISRDLPGGAWFGSPAVPLPEAKRQIALIHRLEKLLERIKAIERKVGL
jgi:UDP-3-O-[3-hydroxymyristoyl] glucosamine N-acyltransferase